VRARVHDEAAFLADEAVDVGGVEPDLARALQHRLAEGHGKALGVVHLAVGALAGVDAAVPHLALTGQVGGGEQFAFTQAARGVQGHLVVPFPHTFAAQAQFDGYQRTLQPGVGPGPGALGRGQGGGARWCDHRPAQRLQRQLFVEPAGASNLVVQGARQGFGVGVGSGVQRPGAPVHPDGLCPLGRAHRVDRTQHLRPGAGAQGGARFPGQQVVVQVAVVGLGEVAYRVGRQPQRRALADHAPHPGQFFLGELGFPAQPRRFGRCGVGVAHGQPDQRQRHQLLGAGADGGHLLVQVTGRVGVDGVDQRHPRRVEHPDRLGGHGRLVALHGPAGALPGGLGVADADPFEPLGQRGAPVVGAALGVPQRAGFVGHRGQGAFALCQQRVALDLAVVVHAELGQLLVERGPVAVLAELQQPVVAQPVLVVGAGVALQEGADLFGAGLGQAGTQGPVRGQWLQRVALHAGQQGRQPFGVAGLESLSHVHEGPLGVGRALRHRCRRREQGRRRQ